VLEFKANLRPSKINLCNEQSGKKIINIDRKRRKKSVKLVGKSKRQNIGGVKIKKIVSVSGSSKRRMHTNNLHIIYTYSSFTRPLRTPSSNRFFLLFLSYILNTSSTLLLQR
jgi:hypothetical protein